MVGLLTCPRVPLMTRSVTFRISDQPEIVLTTRVPTLGYEVVEISELSQQGLLSYDPGFATTAAYCSKITYTDGEKGVLLYRGYPIEQLAEKSDFLTVCYLLIQGELPTADAKQKLQQTIGDQRYIPKHLQGILAGFPSASSHPMAMLMSLMGALAADHHERHNLQSAKEWIQTAFSLVAQIPTLIAMCYRHTQALAFHYPETIQDYATDFRRMLEGPEGYEPDPILSRALDRIFILHADHEQNASTTAVRLTGATGANPYACIAAGMAALWGPAHGGANEACLRMLMEIGNPSRIDAYLKRAKDPHDPFRLMGFGHRIYKTQDPRAAIMRQTCYEVLAAKGVEHMPLFKLALSLEKIALEDDYFIKRRLYPNVDFYSGIILNALGIPISLFTAIFALARTTGWCAHWLEMMGDPQRIGRPRQLYIGHTARNYPATHEKI